LVVFVRLHTVLIDKASSSESNLRLEIPAGQLVKDVIQQLNIIFPEDSLIIAVNHRVTNETRVLQDGDQVDLIPSMSGGVEPIPPPDFLIKKTCLVNPATALTKCCVDY
jgi:molybdopterin converting factor small subunit